MNTIYAILARFGTSACPFARPYVRHLRTFCDNFRLGIIRNRITNLYSSRLGYRVTTLVLNINASEQIQCNVHVVYVVELTY